MRQVDGGASFSGLLVRLRGRARLTQRQLAQRAAVSVRTIQDWEMGVNYPSAERLRSLIAALLDAKAMSAGHEAEEAEQLWAVVQRDAPHMHAPFDRRWLTELSTQRPSFPTRGSAAAQTPVWDSVVEGAGVLRDRRQELGRCAGRARISRANRGTAPA